MPKFPIVEPTDTGIIPPEYRTSFHTTSLTQASSIAANNAHSSLQSTSNENSTVDKKVHQWSTNPVEEWAKEQVIFRHENSYFNFFGCLQTKDL